ncbi:hypothetical protein G3A_02460 [Bacillus sp. 17376]|uniref:hypothetical protein n=1 Tax=Mesobacillus boroniphilus TaxID=308892 RepID=UPI0003C787AC|nr:hypothetical protein [Mesobacillus boroniphilus]ESU34150.1 hypothetical protein G3A_02460 [Bacillus sp. 17376]
MKLLEGFLIIITWFLTILFIPLVGLFFYTPEYELIKNFLDYKVSISILLLFVLLFALLLVFSQLILFIIRLKKKINFIDLDREVLCKIKELIPMDYARNFFERYDFGSGGFPFENIRILHDFIETEGNPEFEFTDNDLEKIRINLLEDLKKLNRILAEHTVRASNTNSEDYWRIDKGLKEKDVDLYIKVIREANQVATDIWENYKRLVEVGRKRFGI